MLAQLVFETRMTKLRRAARYVLLARLMASVISEVEKRLACLREPANSGYCHGACYFN